MTANLDKEWNDAKERLTRAQKDLDNTVQELVDWAVGTVKGRGLASRIAGLEQELREHENTKDYLDELVKRIGQTLNAALQETVHTKRDYIDSNVRTVVEQQNAYNVKVAEHERLETFDQVLERVRAEMTAVREKTPAEGGSAAEKNDAKKARTK